MSAVPWFVLDEREPADAEDAECHVCVDGRYLIMDQHGSDWGTIRCPACYGTGIDLGDDDEDEDDPAEIERHHERLIAAWLIIQSARASNPGPVSGVEAG